MCVCKGSLGAQIWISELCYKEDSQSNEGERGEKTCHSLIDYYPQVSTSCSSNGTFYILNSAGVTGESSIRDCYFAV